MNTTKMIVEVAKALGENAARDPHLVDLLVNQARDVLDSEFGLDYSATAAFVVDMYADAGELDDELDHEQGHCQVTWIIKDGFYVSDKR